MELKKPNVLIAGFPRTGSTYLYQILKQHPEIFIPEIKEINYFNKDHFFLEEPEIINPRYFKPHSWYFNFFKTNKNIIIDFSILSALDTSSAHRVKQLLGNPKILFITRNAKDYENSIINSIKAWNSPIYKNYKKYSDFDYYINNYKKHFSQVFVTSIEKLNANPQLELQKITSFLGAKKHTFNLKVPKHKMPKNYKVEFHNILRRKAYIKFVKFFYKLSSLSVRAKAYPEKANQ